MELQPYAQSSRDGTDLSPNVNPNPDPPGVGVGVGDVLLDLSFATSRFLWEIQNMARSARQPGSAKKLDSEMKTEIQSRVAKHLEEIKALCCLEEEDVNAGTMVTSDSRYLPQRGSSEFHTNMLPSPEQSQDPAPSPANFLAIRSSPPPLNAKFNGAPDKLSNSPRPSEADKVQKRKNLQTMTFNRITVTKKSKYADTGQPCTEQSLGVRAQPSGSSDWEANIDRQYSLPMGRSQKGQHASEDKMLVGEESKIKSEEREIVEGGHSRSSESPVQDVAFWGESSEPETSVQDVAFWGESSELEDENPRPELSDEDQELNLEQHAKPARHSPSPVVESLSKSNIEHKVILVSHAKQGQTKQQSQPPSRSSTARGNFAPFPIPQPRDLNSKARYTGTETVYTHFERPVRQEAPMENSDAPADGELVVHSHQHRNSTAEGHIARFRRIIHERWHTMSTDAQQQYLLRCFHGWRCFYCQILDIDGGCISQLSGHNCYTTIRRGVPCHISYYDEQTRLYEWRKLPRQRRRTYTAFSEIYLVVCGNGNPVTEQKFLGLMFRSRWRCLVCVLLKSHRKGEYCTMQKLTKIDGGCEEHIDVCVRCCRKEVDCFVAIQMTVNDRGEPTSFGLGKVTAGRVEALGPRFREATPEPEAVMAPRGPPAVDRPSQTLARGHMESPNIVPGAPILGSSANIAQPVVEKVLKRTFPLPKRDSGGQSSAGALPERPGEHFRPGGKRQLSPTRPEQKSKIRRLPTYSSPLSYVDQLRAGLGRNTTRY